MHILRHSAEEVDNKLSKIPTPRNDYDREWTRSDAWTKIADEHFDADSLYAQSGAAVAEAIDGAIDQEYDSTSSMAQSGKAVAEAINATMVAITDDEIKAMFSDENITQPAVSAYEGEITVE